MYNTRNICTYMSIGWNVRLIKYCCGGKQSSSSSSSLTVCAVHRAPIFAVVAAVAKLPLVPIALRENAHCECARARGSSPFNKLIFQMIIIFIVQRVVSSLRACLWHKRTTDQQAAAAAALEWLDARCGTDQQREIISSGHRTRSSLEERASAGRAHNV